MQGIYCIKNKTNGKLYIGSSINIDKRFREHKNSLKANKHHSIYLQRSWNNGNEFEFKVIEVVNEAEKLIEREQYYINKFDSYKNGYNMCPIAGRPKGLKHTLQSRKNMLEAHKGQESPMKGKHHTKISRKKISEKGKNRYISLETREKISKALKGKKKSKETKAKMSKAQEGNKKSLGHKRTKEQIEKTASKNRGQKRSIEQRKTMQKSHKSKLDYLKVQEIRKLLENGENCVQIALKYNVSRTTISGIKNNRTWIL